MRVLFDQIEEKVEFTKWADKIVLTEPGRHLHIKVDGDRVVVWIDRDGCILRTFTHDQFFEAVEDLLKREKAKAAKGKQKHGHR